MRRVGANGKEQAGSHGKGIPGFSRRSVMGGLLALPWTRDGVGQVMGGLPGDDAELFQLPGKRPLLKRSFRPPNLETPLVDLRPAFTRNESFFVRYHLGLIPEIDQRSWRLRIGGSSAEAGIELSLQELQTSFERVSLAAVNQCSGNRRGLANPRVPGVQWAHGAIGNATWTGVRLRDVLRRASVRTDAVEAIFEAADSGQLAATPDFTKSLPIDRALDENVLLVFEMNGAPLPHVHGAPVRLVVPGWTATYWVKHLTEIRLEPKAFEGFWMKSGYRVPASVFRGARFTSQETAETWPITEILVNSLITSHERRATVRRGRTIVLQGWSWDGGSGIAAVDVSTDGGRAWQSARLGKDLGRFAWREFQFPIKATQLGTTNVLVRASARSGEVQPEAPIANPSGYHNNAFQRLDLDVVA